MSTTAVKLYAALLLCSVLLCQAEVCRVYPVKTTLRQEQTATTKYHQHTISYECAFWNESGEESDDFAILNLPEYVVQRNQDKLRRGDAFIVYEKEWLKVYDNNYDEKSNDEDVETVPTLQVPFKESNGNMRVYTFDEIGRHLAINDDVPHRKLQFNTTNQYDESNPAKGVVIAVRVTTADAVPQVTAETMNEAIFGSFASQIFACSAEADLIRPFLQNVPVIDVTVSGTTSSYTFDTLFIAANRQLKEYLGLVNNLSIRSLAQFVMFFAPDGLISNPGDIETIDGGDIAAGMPVAYSAYNHFKSVYTDVLVTNTQALLHQTGHNRNLGHTFEGREEKSDLSSAMGSIVADTVNMCYNGVDNAFLGWRDNDGQTRRLSTRTDVGITVVELAFFGDYNKTSADQPLLIVINDAFYLQYNLAKGINSQTREHADTVVIHRMKDPMYISNGTEYIGSLSREGTAFASLRENVTVALCDRRTAPDDSLADTVVVAVSTLTPNIASLCQFASDERVPLAVPMDSAIEPGNIFATSATATPGTGSINGIDFSTGASDAPSDIESDVPSDMLSDMPSDILTLAPSLSPTLIPIPVRG